MKHIGVCFMYDRLCWRRGGFYYIVIVQDIFREFTDNNFMKILLSQIMYERNLSVRQLAILSGVSKSTIQKTMQEDSNPTIRTLEKLAAGLKCRITDLFSSDFK